MRFFHRAEVVLRCTLRGAALAAPDAERLLKSCPETEGARLRRHLARLSADIRWSVEWRKAPGDELIARDVVAVLRSDGIAVEIVCGQRGVLGQRFAAEGDSVGAGDALAAIRKPPVTMSRVDKLAQLRDMLAQFLARHQRDTEQIKDLQTELAEKRNQIDRLRSEVLALRARQSAHHLSGRLGLPLDDRKFKRLKREFTKHFHPDVEPGGDAERRRRERVFQEFWPIVEEIERS